MIFALFIDQHDQKLGDNATIRTAEAQRGSGETSPYFAWLTSRPIHVILHVTLGTNLTNYFCYMCSLSERVESLGLGDGLISQTDD